LNLLVKKDLIPLFLFFILAGCSEQTKENQLNAEAEIDTNRVAIGDVFHYTVTASAPDDRLLGFPELEGSTALEVRSSDHSVDDYGMHKVEFKLALWDTGYHSVPAYPIEVFLRDSTLEQVIRLDSLNVFVFSSIAEDSLFQASGTVGLKPVKNPVPVEIPLPLKTIGLAALMLILLGLIIFIWFRRTPDRFRFAEPFVDAAPPDKAALGKLKELVKQVEKGESSVKEYYTSLSHIIREYLEFAFFVKTLEMTTEEIERFSGNFPFASATKDEWKKVLKQADMVKYAKESADISNVQKDIRSAEAFIKNTTIFWKRNDSSLP